LYVQGSRFCGKKKRTVDYKEKNESSAAYRKKVDGQEKEGRRSKRKPAGDIYEKTFAVTMAGRPKRRGEQTSKKNTECSPGGKRFTRTGERSAIENSFDKTGFEGGTPPLLVFPRDGSAQGGLGKDNVPV